MKHKFHKQNDWQDREMKYTSLGLIILILIILLITNTSVFAQKNNITRTTAHLTTGVSTAFASLNPSSGISLTAALSYVPVNYITLSAEAGGGYISGNGALHKEYKSAARELNNVRFTTTYLYYGLNGSLNLRFFLSKRFKERHRQYNVIPYLTFGSGYLYTIANAHFDGALPENNYEYTNFTHHGGVQVRIKQNNFIDYLFAVRYHFLQTYFFEAIPVYDRYDSFVTFSAGVSYKFNAGHKKKYIDWAYIRKTKCPGSMRHF